MCIRDSARTQEWIPQDESADTLGPAMRVRDGRRRAPTKRHDYDRLVSEPVRDGLDVLDPPRKGVLDRTALRKSHPARIGHDDLEMLPQDVDLRPVGNHLAVELEMRRAWPEME